MSSLTTIDWLPSLIAFMTPTYLAAEQESPPVSASFNEASGNLILASEKIISSEEAKMLSSHDPVIRPKFLMTDAKSTLRLLCLEGVHGLSIAYSRSEAPAPVTVQLGEAPDALSNLDLKPITSGCLLVLQLKDHIKVNQEEIENLVRKVAKTLLGKGHQASQLPLAADLRSNEESKSQTGLSTTSGPSSRSRLSSSKCGPHLDKQDREDKGNLSKRQTMTSTPSLEQPSSSCSHEGAMQAERFSPMTTLQTDPAEAVVEMTFGQEGSSHHKDGLQAPSRDKLNTARASKLDPLEGAKPKRQEDESRKRPQGTPVEIDLKFCFSYLSDLQDISTMNSLRVIENNTVRYDRAIVDYLFDHTPYFSSGDPDFKAQVTGLRSKAKKNATSDVIKRIQKATPSMLGLGYALFREAMSKMTDQTASDQVRTDVEPLFAANPEKGSPEEAYQSLLGMRASGRANEADHLENDLTGQFPECIKFLQTKTLYFVKQKLFQTTMSSIKKDLKSDCFQVIKSCLEPFLQARIGLAWALHIATVRCDHPECSLSQAFRAGGEKSNMKILDSIAQLKGVESDYPDVDLDAVIDMIENHGDDEFPVSSILYEIDELENEAAKEEAKEIILRFARDQQISELEESLVASTMKDESQVITEKSLKDAAHFFGECHESSIAQSVQIEEPAGSIMDLSSEQNMSVRTLERDVPIPRQSEVSMAPPRKRTRLKRPKGQAKKDLPEAKSKPISEEQPSKEHKSLKSHYETFLQMLMSYRYQKQEDKAIAFENELAREDQPALRYLVFETSYFQKMNTYQGRLTQLRTLAKSENKRSVRQNLKSLIPDQVGLAWALHSSLLKETKDKQLREKLEEIGTTLFPTPKELAAQTPIEALRSLAEEHREEKDLSTLVRLMESNPNVERSSGVQINIILRFMLSLVQDPEVKESATKLFNTHFNLAEDPPRSSQSASSEGKDDHLLKLINELEDPSKSILSHWVDSEFASVPSEALTFREEQMVTLYNHILRIEEQFKDSGFSSFAWIKSLSKCPSELQQRLIQLEEALLSKTELSNTKERINQCLKALDQEHPSHPLPARLYALCNRVLPGLDLEVPLSLEELQERDLQAVKEVLPLLERKPFTITDFITVHEAFNVEETMNRLSDGLKKDKKIDGENLIKTMFDFVKRRQPFTNIHVQLKRSLSELKLTAITMFDYLMRHSDSDLRALLVISCSQFMAIPFLFKSPWSPGNVIIEEHIYVFEKSKSVLQVKLSKSGKNLPTGTSEFLDLLLGNSFKTDQQSYVNNGAIQIQYDFNCSLTEYIVAADYNGEANPEIIKKLLPLFDTIIIHSTVDQEAFIRELQEEWKSKAKIVVYFHHPSKKEPEIKQVGTSYWCYHQPFFECKEKKLIIWEFSHIMIDFFKVNLQFYAKNLEQRVNQKKQFIDVLKELNGLQIADHEIFLSQVKKIVDLILKTEDFKSTSFLPILHYTTLKTEIKDELARAWLSEGKKKQLEREQNENEENLKNCSPTEIIDCFKEVISEENTMKISFFLLHLIKGFLSHKILELESKKKLLKEELHQLEDGKDEPKSQALAADIAALDKEVKQLQFSSEHAYREIYHLSQTDKNRQLINYSQKYQRLQIQTGQPCELIDGDNLIFLSDQRKVFSKIENSDEDLLVVSVIGPQSAGKSLLMNFIFGTQFLSSSGRCTKGVYASIIPYVYQNEQGEEKKKNILILDTEGIQSAEAREKDTLFDKRIVYFIMCVSHVVLIVNKQEMNQRMTEVMKLVGEAILNTKQDLIENPSILIVMNMLANSESSTASNCLQTLENSLKDENSDPRIKEALSLTLESIFPLGIAFSSDSFGEGLPDALKKIVNRPSAAISRSIFNLRRAILNKFIDIKQKKTNQFTLDDWIKFAEGFWVFSGEFKQLYEYTDLSEKRKSEKLGEKIDELHKKYYESKIMDQVRRKHDANLQELLDLSTNSKFEALSEKIKDKVDENFREINSNFAKELKQFCEEIEIPNNITEKHQSSLSSSQRSNRKDELNRLNKKISEFVNTLSMRIGDTHLREISIELLKKKDSYSIKEAEAKFQDGWKASIQKTISVLKDEASSKKDVFEDFTNKFDFQAQTGAESAGKCMKLSEAVKEDGLKKMVEDQIKELKTNALVSMQGTVAKNPAGVINFDPSTKKYVKKYPTDAFSKVEKVTVVDLTILLQNIELKERDGILIIAHKILSCVEIKRQFFVGKSKTSGQINDKMKVEDFIQDLKEDYSRFSLQPQLTLDKMQSMLYASTKGKQFWRIQLQSDCSLDDFEKSFSFNLQEYLKDHTNFKYCQSPRRTNSSKKNPKFIMSKGNPKEALERAIKVVQTTDHTLLESQGKHIIDTEPEYHLNHQYKDKQIFKYISGLLKQEKMASKTCSEESLEGFNDFIRWDIFFKDLEKLVIKNIRKDSKLGPRDSISDYLRVFSDANPDEAQKAQTAEEFCDIGAQHIKDIVNSIKMQIEELNKELLPFWLEMQSKGIASLTWVIETMVIILGQELEIYKSLLPVRQFMETKEREREHFIAKLTCNNQRADNSLGTSIASALANFLKNKLQQEAASSFRKSLEEQKSMFEKAETISVLEERLVRLANKKIRDKNYKFTSEDVTVIREGIKFYSGPTEFLERMFEKEFGKLEVKLMTSIKQTFKRNLTNQLEHVRKYFDAVIQELKAKESDKNAQCLFVPYKSPQGKAMTLNNQQVSEAFSKYFQRFVQGVWRDKDIIQVYGGAQLQKHPSFRLPQPGDFQTLDNDLIEIVLDAVRKKTIFKLDDMLLSASSEIKKTIEDHKSKDPQTNEDITKKIRGECMKDFKRLYTGCPFFCPMCKRQCDVQHDVNKPNEPHRCRTGHQLQCLGGNKKPYKNQAITKSCTEIKEDEIVVYNQEEYKWAVLKQKKLTDWVYDQTDDAQAQEVREKSSKIWNLIGPQLCEEYKRNRNNPIDFIEASAVQTSSGGGRVHYIMALDESGSMRGRPWESVKSALKNFLSQLELMNSPGTKVSIVKYDSTSTIAFEKVGPEARIASQLTYRGGGTDFDPPLNDAFTLARKYQSEFDQIIIYFMTDGQASYTMQTVKQFHEPTISYLIGFHAVSFGRADSDLMENLAKDMPNGKKTEAPTPEDLRNSMAKIIVYSPSS